MIPNFQAESFALDIYMLVMAETQEPAEKNPVLDLRMFESIRDSLSYPTTASLRSSFSPSAIIASHTESGSSDFQNQNGGVTIIANMLYTFLPETTKAVILKGGSGGWNSHLSLRKLISEAIYNLRRLDICNMGAS